MSRIVLVHFLVHFCLLSLENKGKYSGFESLHLHEQKVPVDPRKSSIFKGLRDFYLLENTCSDTENAPIEPKVVHFLVHLFRFFFLIMIG